jgi:hypothetical protein
MRSLAAYVLLASLSLPGVAFAQSAEPSTIHWAYSTYFGTGWYQVDDSRNAFAVRYTPRRLIRRHSLVEGRRIYGIELRVPVTVGLNHFPLDDLSGSVNPDNLANVSITPAVNLQIPVSERWTLRPFAALGWGTVLNGDESAWTYWAGIRSRYTFQSGALDGAWINSAGFVGYSPNNGPSSNFWPLMTGLEFAYPLGAYRLQEEQFILNWHASYTFFGDDLEVLNRALATEAIPDQWELGLGFSKEETPIGVWRFHFDRLGLAYRFSSDGDLQGIGFVFNSLFDL